MARGASARRCGTPVSPDLPSKARIGAQASVLHACRALAGIEPPRAASLAILGPLSAEA